MSYSPPGQVLGTPGGSLNHYSSWGHGSTDAARVGQNGEVRTARILDQLAAQPGGPTVLHDLRIPLKDYKANIDHIVVAGHAVVIIDTKVWRPGLYWTLGGKTRIGLKRAEHVDKKTMAVANRAITGLLDKAGTGSHVADVFVAVWSSRHHENPNLRFASMPGADLIRAEKMERRLRSLKRAGSADPATVQALSQFLN